MSAQAARGPPTAVRGPGAETRGRPWLRRHKNNLVSVQTYFLNSDAFPGPPPPTSVGTRVRLPALTAKVPRRRSGLARLSLSEPSLFPHKDSVSLEVLSHGPSLLHKRSTSSSSSNALVTPNPPARPPDPSRPLYLHFSRCLQPSVRPRAQRRHSHTAVQVSPRPEPLSVVGKTCVPVSSPRPAPAPRPSRAHIHVFLPSEAEVEDSESVDEGFMDELDLKMSSLRLQQGAPHTLPQLPWV
ncbi:unnamed protein product [Knipowitschia caucasica]|uniref:Uncharacterized protein n=1 Tax=Knipowitschia caucasica TaxID=637954 RepID=A0AAV2K574_KNICA